MERYDRAITIFSPDGHLFQVDYAQEAVKKGSTVIGVAGKTCVVLGVEKKSIPTLQDDRTIHKIHKIDEHVMVAFAGLSADARVLVDYARCECESYKLSLEDSVSIGHLARCIADVKQEYTQTTGHRPFGISMLIGGFDNDGTPRLFKTDPSGVFFEFRGTSLGRSEKQVREYLEEHYSAATTANEQTTLEMVAKALSQVVQTGAQNIEIAVLTLKSTDPFECSQRLLSVEEIDALLKKIEASEQSEKEKAGKK